MVCVLFLCLDYPAKHFFQEPFQMAAVYLAGKP